MNYFSEMIKSVKELVKIDSVETAPVGNMPFGKGVYDALKYMLDLGESFGFKSINYDNYVGEIVWGDDDDNAMAILCHLDVVPVGNLSDWKYPPFSAEEVDGKIYGRGTTDDKAPAVCVLYCLKALKDQGFKPSKTIKLILGCDEESGWECIEHYKKVAKMPEFGFSPDAGFPVLYAEKGILHAEFSFKYDQTALFEISGGTRPNVVCDYATCVTSKYAPDLIEKLGLTWEEGQITARGVTAHGSTPEKGKNALLPLLTYLAETQVIDKSVVDKLFNDSLKLKELNDDTGYLTMSPDIIRKEGDNLVVTVDFRYPSTFNGDYILQRVSEIAPIKVLGHQLPLYNDKNGKMIQTLLGIYNKTMGTNLEPLAIGGGTYARALKIGTAFGPEFPDEEETIHQPNEYISIKNLELCFKMYKEAIYELTK